MLSQRARSKSRPSVKQTFEAISQRHNILVARRCPRILLCFATPADKAVACPARPEPANIAIAPIVNGEPCVVCTVKYLARSSGEFIALGTAHQLTTAGRTSFKALPGGAVAVRRSGCAPAEPYPPQRQSKSSTITLPVAAPAGR